MMYQVIIAHKETKVGIIVGEYDKNAFPELSDDYFKLLKENSIYSELKVINITYSFDYNFNNK